MPAQAEEFCDLPSRFHFSRKLNVYSANHKTTDRVKGSARNRHESGKERIPRKFFQGISQRTVKIRLSGLAQNGFPGLSTNDFRTIFNG